MSVPFVLQTFILPSSLQQLEFLWGICFKNMFAYLVKLWKDYQQLQNRAATSVTFNLRAPGSWVIPYSQPRLCPIPVCVVLCDYRSFVLTEDAVPPPTGLCKRVPP